MKKITIYMILTILMLNSVLALNQDLPIQFQLQDSSGKNIVADTIIEFNIYDNVTGGVSLYSHTETIEFSQGVGNVILPDVDLDFDVDYWIGINPATTGEMTPRINYTSSTYDLNKIEYDILTNSPYVDVRSFGAIPGDSIDDSIAIQKAIDYNTNGGVVIFPLGEYLISTTINITRGTVLRGIGATDTNTGHSTIKLMDHSNCVMIATPGFYDSADSTHFMGIENLLIDGNSDNQDYENIAIGFHGVFVGSWIENVFVYKVLGPALSIANGSDITVRNFWANFITTDNHAIEINKGKDGSIAEHNGRILFEQLYVEGVYFLNGSRGRGVLANRLNELVVTNFHFEHQETGFDIIDCNNVLISEGSFGAVGNESYSNSAGFVLDGINHNLQIGPCQSAYHTKNWKFVRRAIGNTDDNYPETTLGTTNFLRMASYETTADGTTQKIQVTPSTPREIGLSYSDLIFYYPLNDNLIDYSGYGNEGALGGSAYYGQGKKGTGVNFKNTGDQIVTPNTNICTEINGSSSVSMATWVKFDDFGSYSQDIFGIYYGGGAFTLALRVILEKNIYALIRTSSGSDSISFNADIQADDWVHIVSTYDGSDLKLYINGFLKSTSSHTGTMDCNFGLNTYMGYRSTPMNGTIDEPMIFNRTLTQEEVKIMYSKDTEHISTEAYQLKNTDQTMSSPDGNKWCCSVDNTGVFACVSGAC